MIRLSIFEIVFNLFTFYSLESNIYLAINIKTNNLIPKNSIMSILYEILSIAY